MQDNNISSTNCLKVNFMSIDKLFMCELERTNGTKTPRLYKKKDWKKLEDAYLLISLLCWSYVRRYYKHQTVWETTIYDF